MSLWQTELSVEQLVAMNMGDEDWEDLQQPEDEGCSRAKTMEPDRSNYIEAEPMGLKYNPLFEH